MTKDEFQRKVRKLIYDNRDEMLTEATRLFNSGGIDTDFYDDGGYALPKLVLSIALERLAAQWVPDLPKQRSDYNNLRRF